MKKVIRDLYNYREMLKTSVRKDLRSRYKGSFLGFLWTFVNPLMQLLIYTIVFKFVMRVTVPGYDYSVFLFVGLVPWASFSTGMVMSTTVFVINANLIKKIYFPRFILPMSTISSNLVNMLFAMGVVFPVLWISGVPITINYLFFPLVFFIQALLMYGFGILFSSLYVYFRDLEHIINILVMAWFYMTPVLYTPDFVLHPLYHVLKLNPMFAVINSYRDVLLFGKMPDLIGLSYSLVFGLFILIVGYASYDRLQRRFAEEM